MEDAGKRALIANQKFSSTERAFDLSRLKKDFDSTEPMDMKRGFDSIDHFSDMAALKRRFDSSGVKRHFDSIGHYSDMHELKRNGEGDLGFVGKRKKFNSFEHSSGVDNMNKDVDSISHLSVLGALKRTALSDLASDLSGKSALDSNERSPQTSRLNKRSIKMRIN